MHCFSLFLKQEHNSRETIELFEIPYHSILFIHLSFSSPNRSGPSWTVAAAATTSDSRCIAYRLWNPPTHTAMVAFEPC